MRSHCILDNVQIPTFLCDYAMFDKRSGRVDDTAIHWRGAVVSINNYKSFMYDLLASASVTKTARFVSSILFMSAAIFGGFFIPVANASSNVAITAPTSASIWRGSQTIQWSDASSAPNYGLFYSSDFSFYQNIINNVEGTGYVWNTALVADGSYKIKIINSLSEFAISDTFIIDNTPPTFVVNNGVEIGPVQSDTIKVTADATISGLATTEYGFSPDSTCDVLDTFGNAFTSGVDFSVSSDHTNFLCVKATDNAGNIGYQLVGQLNTDNTSPTIPVANIIGTTVQAADDTIVITFDGPVVATDGTFSANEFTSITGSVSGALTLTNAIFNYSGNALTITLNQATDGAHLKNGETITADPVLDAIKDAAGNFLVDAAVVGTTAVTGDVAAPTVMLTYSPDRQIRDADTVVVTATFNETITGIPQIAIDTSGVDVSATSMSGSGLVWTYSWDIPADSDGVATITISGATDLAGNANAAATNNTRTIDNTAPAVSSYTLNGLTQNVAFKPGIVAIDITTNEPVQYNRIRVCTNADATCNDTTDIKSFTTSTLAITASKTWDGKNASSVDAPDGVYKLKVSMDDEAGNNTVVTLSPYLITIDRINPTSSLFSAPVADAVYKTNTPLQFTPDDSATAVTCAYKIDSGSYVPVMCTAATTVSTTIPDISFSDGRHTVMIKVTDAAGNLLESSAVSFVFDNNNTLTVGPSIPESDFTTIQEAINKATVDDAISVAAGTYDVTSTPGIIVDKSVTISGTSADTTTVTGRNKNGSVVNGSDVLFNITANNVTIEKLTIDLGDSDSDYDVGVFTANSGGINNLTVRNSTLLFAAFGNSIGEQLIHLGGGSGSTVSDNTLETASGNSGLYVGDGTNTLLTISGNTVAPQSVVSAQNAAGANDAD